VGLNSAHGRCGLRILSSDGSVDSRDRGVNLRFLLRELCPRRRLRLSERLRLGVGDLVGEL
jgi:hypothetical protein